jgi:hypothetical protein
MDLFNVRCECCGDLDKALHRPVKGILCDQCFKPELPSCTRVMPLVILRSAINEIE